jgi:hypothetical protein
MIAEGIDVKTAQQRLGHSDVRMTLGLYAKVIESADRSASDVLASRFLGNDTPNPGNARGARDGHAMEARKDVTRGDPSAGESGTDRDLRWSGEDDVLFKPH